MNNLKKSNQVSKSFTRECIRTALIYLMKETPLNEITVTSIIQRAGVSRAGFYRNYGCKEDVLQDISNTLYKKLQDYFKEELSILEPYQRYVKLFQRLKERSDMFELLLKTPFQHNKVFDFDFFIHENKAPSIPEEHYRYIGMVYAHRFIMREWFQNGMIESPEEMAEILCNIFEHQNYIIQHK